MRLDKHTPSHSTWTQYVAREGTKQMSRIDQREMSNYIRNVAHEYNDFHGSFNSHPYCDDHAYSGSSDYIDFDSFEHKNSKTLPSLAKSSILPAKSKTHQDLAHLECSPEDSAGEVSVITPASRVRRRVGGPAGMVFGALGGVAIAALVPGGAGDVAAMVSVGTGLVYAHPGWVKVLQKRADRKALQSSAQAAIEAEQSVPDSVSAPQHPLPLRAQQVLDSIETMSQYVLGKLEHLPGPQARLEAQALVHTHLPELLSLYQDSIDAVQTDGARKACEDDLCQQLDLVRVEIEFLRDQVEAEARRKQREFGHFLDAKLGRSELD